MSDRNEGATAGESETVIRHEDVADLHAVLGVGPTGPRTMPASDRLTEAERAQSLGATVWADGRITWPAGQDPS